MLSIIKNLIWKRDWCRSFCLFEGGCRWS